MTKKLISLFLLLCALGSPAMAEEVYDSTTGKAMGIEGTSGVKNTKKNQGEAEIEISHNIFRGVSAKIHIRWKVGILMGDPVTYGEARWDLESVRLEDPVTKEDVTIYARDIPPEVLEKIIIWDMKIYSILNVGPYHRDEITGYKFDFGAMEGPGKGWSFSVPGSPSSFSSFLSSNTNNYSPDSKRYRPSAEKVMLPDGMSKEDVKSYGWCFVKDKFAKKWVAEGLNFRNHRLINLGVDLNPVKEWLHRKNSKELAKQRQQAIKQHKKEIRKLEQDKKKFAKKQAQKSEQENAEDFFDTFEEESSYEEIAEERFKERRKEIMLKFADTSIDSYIQDLRKESARLREKTKKGLDEHYWSCWWTEYHKYENANFELMVINTRKTTESKHGPRPYWVEPELTLRTHSIGKKSKSSSRSSAPKRRYHYCAHADGLDKNACKKKERAWYELLQAEKERLFTVYLENNPAKKNELKQCRTAKIRELEAVLK